MHTPKHASNSSNVRHWARFTAAAVIFSFLGAFFIGMMPQLRANAATRVNWTERTCNAASAYVAHPSAARMATLVIDSTHLGRGYLKWDVASLYSDVSSMSSKAAKYVASDEQYITQDCTTR